MKLVRQVVRFIAVAALSSFLTLFVLNQTLLSSAAWLKAADTAHVYAQGAAALNTALAAQPNTAKVTVTPAAVQAQVERYVAAIDHYIRTGEVAPNLEGFSQLISPPPGATPASQQQSTQALAWLRLVLAQQALIGIVSVVALLFALLIAQPGRRPRALAGMLFSTALSLGLWYGVLRFAPNLLTDNLTTDPSLAPFVPVFKNWLVAVFAIVNEQLLTLIIGLSGLALVCLVASPIARFFGRFQSHDDDSPAPAGSRALD